MPRGRRDILTVAVNIVSRCWEGECVAARQGAAMADAACQCSTSSWFAAARSSSVYSKGKEKVFMHPDLVIHPVLRQGRLRRVEVGRKRLVDAIQVEAGVEVIKQPLVPDPVLKGAKVEK